MILTNILVDFFFLLKLQLVGFPFYFQQNNWEVKWNQNRASLPIGSVFKVITNMTISKHFLKFA